MWAIVGHCGPLWAIVRRRGPSWAIGGTHPLLLEHSLLLRHLHLERARKRAQHAHGLLVRARELLLLERLRLLHLLDREACVVVVLLGAARRRWPAALIAVVVVVVASAGSSLAAAGEQSCVDLLALRELLRRRLQKGRAHQRLLTQRRSDHRDTLLDAVQVGAAVVVAGAFEFAEQLADAPGDFAQLLCALLLGHRHVREGLQRLLVRIILFVVRRDRSQLRGAGCEHCIRLALGQWRTTARRRRSRQLRRQSRTRLDERGSIRGRSSSRAGPPHALLLLLLRPHPRRLGLASALALGLVDDHALGRSGSRGVRHGPAAARKDAPQLP